jgi:hypothetical protein
MGHNDMCPGLPAAPENPGHIFMTDEALLIGQFHLSIKTDWVMVITCVRIFAA